MKFSLQRAVVFASVGLPLDCVLGALFLAISEQPILAGQMLPGGLAVAGVAAAFGGLWRSPE